MRYILLFILFGLSRYINVLSINSKHYKFGTKIVHGGCNTDTRTGNFITPIILGTTFTQILPGKKPGKLDPNSHELGYFYGRMGNPTRGSLERALALVENAKYAAVFSSGMGAISTIIQTLEPGDSVLAMDDLYGGTSNYFNNIATKSSGINFTFNNFSDLHIVKKLIKPETKIIWIESLTNPLLKTVDIKAVAKLAKKHNCLLVVDSTFTSPYLFNPLDVGADIVIHSATKYIGGHSDIIMGVIACNNKKLINKIRAIQSGVGAVPSPFDCYLALRGLKTLHLRMEASQNNALKLAEFLESHYAVDKVIYPGLKCHPQFDLVKSQFRGSGSIISFYMKGETEMINKFLKSLKILKLAVSLGAVESLLCAPALMTHASVPKDVRESIGVTDNLIRISVGIEDINDIIQDISQAFDKSVNIFKNNN